MKEEESCLHKTTEAVFMDKRHLIPESEEKEKPSPRKGFVAYEPEYENIKIQTIECEGSLNEWA